MISLKGYSDFSNDVTMVFVMFHDLCHSLVEAMAVTAALGTGVESHDLSTTFVLWNLFRGLLRWVFAGSNGFF